jgi:hypothetical protein
MTTQNSMSDNIIVYRAAVDGTGYTAGEQVEVSVEGAHTSGDGIQHPPAAFISGQPQLDAARLRRLAAESTEAADRLEHLRH